MFKFIKVEFWVMIIFTLLGIGMALRSTFQFPFHSKEPTVVSAPHESIDDLILSVSHTGQIIVSKVDFKTQTKSRYDSKIFDPVLTSWTISHIEVGIDLAAIKKEWFSLHDKELIITIPASAIKAESFPTDYGENTNGSYGFIFEAHTLEDMRQKNHDQLRKQVDAEATREVMANRDAVAMALQKLYATPLSQKGYRVTAILKDKV